MPTGGREGGREGGRGTERERVTEGGREGGRGMERGRAAGTHEVVHLPLRGEVGASPQSREAGRSVGDLAAVTAIHRVQHRDDGFLGRRQGRGGVTN